MTTDTLFPDVEFVPLGNYLPPPGSKLSSQRRLTLRQAWDIARGKHPLTGYPLAVGTETCGSCALRTLRQHNDRRYPKCTLRETHGAATDCRKWWPACSHWTAKP